MGTIQQNKVIPWSLCCLKQLCENFVILVNLKKQHWCSYCTLDLLVSRALLVQELFLVVLAAVECLLWYFSTSAGVSAWRALVKWVCNWNSFWGCSILFLSVLVAVMCSYCTAALQTGLCWPGTVSLYALEALGLVFLPTWFFGDASVVQTSHVTACPRATMCFAVLWVWSNGVCVCGGGMLCHECPSEIFPRLYVHLSVFQHPLNCTSVFFLKTSCEFERGINQSEFYQLCGTLTLRADEQPCCPGAQQYDRFCCIICLASCILIFSVWGWGWQWKRLALRQHSSQ